MYEIREDEIINPKDGIPTLRIARFLKPNARNINQLSDIPNTPLVVDIFTYQNLQKWPLNVHFDGWNKPQKNWLNWFNKLVVNHATTWIKAGIIDGILASLHNIPCNHNLTLGVCEFWCQKTSSFVFPRGEATITLEDVMILGGLPVIGEPINKPIDDNLVKFDTELRRARRELSLISKIIGKNGEKVVSHSSWVEHFMEEEEEEGEIEHKEEEGEFEHVAFLAFWLSRFVFPDINEGIVGNFVFPIATHLSQGTPIALAPAVLANIYHELTLLTQYTIDLPLDSNYHACALFKIVQLWVCERFPEFGAKLARPLGIGDPRVVRWDNVEFEVSLLHVRSRLKVGEGFRWRPYACDLENWDHLPFYDESEQNIANCAVLDDCLMSFGRFLCSSEMHGLKISCREKYQPHRVAMQFGYDQDIPGEFRVSAANWDKGGLYIPSRTFDPGVSRSYLNWWRDSMLCHEEVVADLFRRKRGKSSDEMLVDRPEIGECNKGKSSCASPRLMLETCENKSDKSNYTSDLDNVPLALRLCSKVANKNAPFSKMIGEQTSVAVKSPRITIKGPCDSNIGKADIKAKKDMISDPVDTDHIPLALRLQLIAQSTGAVKSPESYASTENAANPFHERSLTKHVTSQGSDADSYITKRSSSINKIVDEAEREVKANAVGTSSSELVDWVAKLERAVAALGASKLGNAELSDCDQR